MDSLFSIKWVFIIFASYLALLTLINIGKINFFVFLNHPQFVLKAIGISFLSSLIGFLINGYFSTVIILYGLIGFIIYLLYFLFIENY